MAENEVKEEKKPIEMSFWFILLIIVIIVSAACIIKVNRQLKEVQAGYEQVQKDLAQKEKQYNDLCQTVLDVVNKKVDGEITDKALISALSGAVNADEGEQPVEEGSSGEDVVETPVAE